MHVAHDMSTIHVTAQVIRQGCLGEQDESNLRDAAQTKQRLPHVTTTMSLSKPSLYTAPIDFKPITCGSIDHATNSEGSLGPMLTQINAQPASQWPAYPHFLPLLTVSALELPPRP